MSRHMKILTGLLLSSVVCVQAHAADMVLEDTALPDPIVANEFDWTGFYAGGQLGYGRAEADATILGATAGGDLTGIVGGGFIGYNYQIDNIVLGVVADFNFADWNDDDTTGGFTASSQMDYIGTVGPRIGLAMDRALFYVEGGYAFTELEAEVSGPGLSFSDDEKLNGYFLGAGIDYALTDTVFVGAEYNYAQFEDANFNIGGVAVDVDDLDAHVFKARVGFKF